MTNDLAQLESQVLTERSTANVQAKIDRAMAQCREHADVLKAVADHGVETARLMHGSFVDLIVANACLVFWLQRFVDLHNDVRELIVAQRAADQSNDDSLDNGVSLAGHAHGAQAEAPSAIGQVDASGDADLSPDFRCQACNKQLHEGEKYWSVNVNLETFEAGAITVHRSDCYRIYCEACGNARNFDDDTDSLGAA